MGFYKTDRKLLWPQKRIYYKIDPSLSSSNAKLKNLIKQAILIWDQSTSLHFIETNKVEINYLYFTHGNQIGSRIGLQNIGKQDISLQSKSKLTHVLHEIGHAVGLYHEHTRPDRDNHISLIPENIKGNFNDTQYGVPKKSEPPNKKGEHFDWTEQYDFDSVMHYSNTTFALEDFNGNKLPTFKLKDTARSVEQIGNATIPSKLDIEAVEKFYSLGRNEVLVSFNIRDDFINDIQSELGVGSAFDVTQEAFKMLSWAINEKKEGNVLLSINEDGTDIKRYGRNTGLANV